MTRIDKEIKEALYDPRFEDPRPKKKNYGTAITPHRPKRRESGAIFHEIKIRDLEKEKDLYGDKGGLIQLELDHHRKRLKEIRGYDPRPTKRRAPKHGALTIVGKNLLDWAQYQPKEVKTKVAQFMLSEQNKPLLLTGSQPLLLTEGTITESYPTPKYKLGDMVFSYQNPTAPAPIIQINPSSDPGYEATYILRIPTASGEGTKNSYYINEGSLTLAEEPQAGEFKASRLKVNKQLAERSAQWTSHFPEKAAKFEIDSFVGHVQSVYDELKKYAKTDAQKAFLKEEMERYQDGYAKKYDELLAAKGRTISSFITGGSNFPVRRAEKANQAERNRYEAMKEWDERAQNAIKRELKKLIVEEAGGELEVLKAKLERAKEAHKMMVESNKIIKKKGITTEEKKQHIKDMFGLKDETINKMFIPDYMGQIGFPGWNLQNSNANIHRMEARVKELEKKETTPTSEKVLAMGRIVDNADEDRIQIFFNEKPDEAIRAKLKASGWRWSPSQGAWQRKRTEAAKYSAQQMIYDVRKRK